MTDLISTARDWIAHDPDPRTRTELAALIDAAQSGNPTARADLESRFDGPLVFGTAGLRGPVGGGQSRMNVAVVIRATAGLARYLLDTVGTDATVVIGRDARHGSADFAEAAAQVISAAGLTAHTLPGPLPTPITAFAVRALQADAGIMITASHNPPADNGYKVYLGGRATDDAGRGVQIVPPADAEIASRITTAPAANLVARNSIHVHPAGSSVVDNYVTRTAALRPHPGPCPIRVALTALHGVGGATMLRVFEAAGIGDVHVVREQFEPDPDFPTVTFPNPEEPGAIDLSIALAQRVSADIVIAVDPDADRCSVAVTDNIGRWRQLTGDQVGWLLGEQAAADDTRPGTTLACSIVSSRMLSSIADDHRLPAATTLTGFKWIARAPRLRFGYEEAIGYCTDPAAVRDKDGISAAVRIITLAEGLAAQGKTIDDELDRLARRHGLYATSQRSLRADDIDRLAEIMMRLRTTPPTDFGGSPVVEVRDLAQGGDDLPPTDGMLFRTAADDRVVVRPSGTEPKIKCYLEVRLPCPDDRPIPHEAAANRLAVLADSLSAYL